jgi:CRP-like cAMP-binding protein
MSEDNKDERFYRDTEAIAFPKLDDWQLALLEPLGHRRMLRRGELVFKAGQRDLGLTVVLSGEVEAFEARDGIEQILGTSGPRGFVGDVAMLNGTSAVASVRGKAEESEILEIPAAELRRASGVARRQRAHRERIHHAAPALAARPRVRRPAYRRYGWLARWAPDPRLPRQKSYPASAHSI